MGTSDPFLTYLKSSGYSVVRLPRPDLRPLQIFVSEGTRLTRLGDLATILKPGSNVATPTIKENVAAAGISGERTRDLGIGVGLSLLGNIIGAMGGSTLGLDAGYKDARTVAFEFVDVLDDRVDLAEIDQYLTDADVSAFSSHVGRLLEADAIYVTTSTIKTKTFVVEAKGSQGTTLEVGVPMIQGMVGGSVKVAAAGSTTAKLAYVGSVPLVFGFQAARLFYQDGRYTAFAPLPPGTAALETTITPHRARGEYLTSDSPFVRLDA